MDWLRTLLKAIEAFVERAYRKPVWIISTIVCGSLITFVWSYQSSIQQVNAKAETASNERWVEIEDSVRFLTIGREVQDLKEPVEKIMSELHAVNQDIIAHRGTLDDYKQRIEGVSRLMVEARKQTEVLIARLRGTSFRVNYLNDDIAGWERFLSAVSNALKLLEDIYAPYLVSDYRGLAQNLNQSDSQFENLHKEFETSGAQMESNTLRARSAIEVRRIELRQVFEEVERYRILGVLRIPAILAVLVYVVCIFGGVWLQVGKPRTNKAVKKRRRR